MQEFVQQLINGLSLGAIYALIAVGYTMVYGVLQLINFAHGDVFMVGAVMVLIIARAFGFVTDDRVAHSWLAFILCALCAVTACGLLGFLVERFAYRPLRNRPRINSLITAIGVSLFLEYGGQHKAIFGPTPPPFPVDMLPGLTGNLFKIGDVVGTRIDAMIIAVTIVLMVGLSYIVLRTKTGLALRAVSHRFETAALMGVNIDRIISFTFVLGSVLAGTAGILYAIKYPKVEPLMGLLPGIKAFVAAGFGGIGEITRAGGGGVVLGVGGGVAVGGPPHGLPEPGGV